MFLKLAILFTAVPVMELALLIKLGNAIGLWPTLLIAFGTGILGAVITRRQGMRAIGAVRDEMAQGRPPSESLLNGFLILVGGLILLTPGLITDFLGFCLLAPFTRKLFVDIIKKNLREYTKKKSADATIIIR